MSLVSFSSSTSWRVTVSWHASPSFDGRWVDFYAVLLCVCVYENWNEICFGHMSAWGFWALCWPGSADSECRFLSKQSVCVYVYDSDSNAMSVTGTPQSTSAAFNSLQCKCVAEQNLCFSYIWICFFFPFLALRLWAKEKQIRDKWKTSRRSASNLSLFS